MDNPDWAARLSANSTLWAAIFAGLGVVATVSGIVVAYRALRWAKKAAQETAKTATETEKQAEAALAAAISAPEQVDLMRQGMRWAEPQPVVRLIFDYQMNGNAEIAFENVEEDLGFDVTLGSISVKDSQSDKLVVMTFVQLPVLRKGEKLSLVVKQVRPELQPPINILPGPGAQMYAFLQLILKENYKTSTEISGTLSTPQEIAIVNVDYSSVRAATFRQEFRILAIGATRIDCQPVGSLIRHRIKTNESPFGKQ